MDLPYQRVDDFRRHLQDLRSHKYEGTDEREDRERTFTQAMNLLNPVATRVLGEFNRVMLSGKGTVTHTGLERQEDGGVQTRWHLSWPEQQTATRRIKGTHPVPPIEVRAHFPPGWTHGHMAGAEAGHWPFQILTAEDAERQALVIWCIAELELHERMYESVEPWTIVPMYTEDKESVQD